MSRSAKDFDQRAGEELDLGQAVPTTAEDVAMLRRLHEQPVSLEQGMAAVRAAGPRTTAELRRRSVSRGRPFEL
jgi:hypothetical protein